MTESGRPPPVLLAAASGGGHWIELLRVRPAFEGWNVVYVSTFDTHASELSSERLRTLPDATRFQKWALVRAAMRALVVVAQERPDAIVTTGSAPMLMLILFGRLFGARTLWIDSIAQSEEMSLSGRIARYVAHKCVVQWPSVTRHKSVEYWGSVIG